MPYKTKDNEYKKLFGKTGKDLNLRKTGFSNDGKKTNMTIKPNRKK